MDNLGYKIEDRMMRQFRGEPHYSDEVDFQTTKALYEVKSCTLFRKTYNGNHQRKFKKRQHKRCVSLQLGRFSIKTHNHVLLKQRAEEESKDARYLFVVRVGKQVFYKVIPWESMEVDVGSPVKNITIRRVFGNEFLR